MKGSVLGPGWLWDMASPRQTCTSSKPDLSKVAVPKGSPSTDTVKARVVFFGTSFKIMDHQG